MLGKKQSKFSQYTDPAQGFSNRSLMLGEWYIRHKLFLRKILIVILLIWSFVTIGIGLTAWGTYLLIDYQKIEQNMVSMTGSYIYFPAWRQYFAPRDLKITEIDGYKSNPGRVDLIARVTNPNSSWIAEIDYQFTYSGKKTEMNTMLVLPGNTHIAAALGVENDSIPTNTRILIEDIKWKRINPHVIQDPLQYVNSRLIFTPTNIVFTPSSKAKDLITHTIEFDISNDSIYNFWETSFHVLYKSRGHTVGVTQIFTDEFRSETTKHIELKSLVNKLKVDKVEIIPNFNPFDQNIYIPLGR